MTEMLEPMANEMPQQPVNQENDSAKNETTTLEVNNTTTSDTPQTCEEVVAKVKILAQDPLNAPKEELEKLKLLFYKLHRANVEAAREAYIAANETADGFQYSNAIEEEYKAAVSIIKEKRAEQQKAEEQERENNYERKEAILSRIQEMLENADKEQASYNDFKALQQEWKTIGEVPASKSADQWKRYQQLTERFYDILKLNIEFREYDFKKNLEAKLRLCEAAERLSEESDVVSAFHQLQKLHEEYRGIGPVAKELREEVWTRFKTASSEVNKRHQQHFEAIKQAELANLEKKTAICEKVEAFPYETFTSYAIWSEKTQEIIALQEEWRTIGYAPQKMNTKIFERFRTACDNFFERKAEFFKDMKNNLAENLEKKTRLCEQAEALKDSTDWKATSDKLAALQREWKETGPVAKKYSDALWQRFISACDAFFEKRKAAGTSQRSEEHQNLAKKQAVIAELKTMDPASITEKDSNKLHELIRQWNAIGHVPYREKDKVYKEYKELIDALFTALHALESNRKVARFKESIKEGMNVGRERERLLRAYDNMCSEIKTYENNLGFLTSSSKSGNSLVAEMQRKVEKLKADAEIVLKKIRALEDKE